MRTISEYDGGADAVVQVYRKNRKVNVEEEGMDGWGEGRGRDQISEVGINFKGTTQRREGGGATRGMSLIVGVGVLEPWEGMK